MAAERQVTAVFMAAGAKATLPTYEQARVDFDAALIAQPTEIDRERAELLRALGVAS